MIRTAPRQHVNFDTSEVHIIKVFNEFDRLRHRYFHDPKATAEEKRVYELSLATPEPDYWAADFQLVTALIQMPHLDVVKELEKRKGSPFSELDRRHLDLRIRAAKYWLENHATEEEKTRLQETLPGRAHELTAAQRGFLHVLAGLLRGAPGDADALQSAVFSAARLTPIDQPSAFKAFYRVLLDRDSGPKAGNLLSFLEREFVLRRCLELEVDKLQLWTETGLSQAALVEWLKKEKPKITALAAKLDFLGAAPPNERGCGAVEFFATMGDGRTFCQRVLFEEAKRGDFEAIARQWIREVEGQTGGKLGL
jgi:lysyl-tRNA synthetase class 1